jgi:hypothetical protein
MSATYKISAIPELYTEGEYKGKLRGVTFTASSPHDTMEWFTRNCGQFETAFARIMAPELAKVMVTSLMHNDAIDFPALYHKQQFARGFMFEWSPVYLVAPSAFAFHVSFGSQA